MDEPIAMDKIAEIEVWLFDVKHELEKERISYGELAQIDNVYEIVKQFIQDK